MLAQAITLIESNAEHHFRTAQKLLQELLPHSGNAIRIGITGVPGAGKSTFIEAFGTFLCDLGLKGGGSAAPEAPAALAAEAPATPAASTPAPAAAAPVAKTDNGGARYSPAVLKLSQEHGIDLSQVTGTGAGGRITRKDLNALIESGNIPKAGAAPVAPVQETAPAAAAAPAPQAAAPKAAAATNVPVVPGDIEIPVSGVRKAIAANMLKSKHEAPHAWTMIEVDVTNLMSFRNSLKADFKKKEGFNLTPFAFFVKAVAQALKIAKTN